VFGSSPRIGGLGGHVSQVLEAFSRTSGRIQALGPLSVPDDTFGETILLRQGAPRISEWTQRFTSLRWRHGELQLQKDTILGRWASEHLQEEELRFCYVFTQVGLESLKRVRDRAIRTVLDNPNGHIEHHRRVCVREAELHCRCSYLGHPSAPMVERVAQEYEIAQEIRVSSHWARESMIARGVPAEKVVVRSLGTDVHKFKPSGDHHSEGPLRILYVGALSLGKGFIYLLRAVRKLRPHVQLEIVGSTGDRCSRRIFARESEGLPIVHNASDPRAAYGRAELFVSPTLHDGFGFVVAEAMASGVPVIVTDQAGVSEWVDRGDTGWVCGAGNDQLIQEALEKALERRASLHDMGMAARETAVRRSSRNEIEEFVFDIATRRVS